MLSHIYSHKVPVLGKLENKNRRRKNYLKKKKKNSHSMLLFNTLVASPYCQNINKIYFSHSHKYFIISSFCLPLTYLLEPNPCSCIFIHTALLSYPLLPSMLSPQGLYTYTVFCWEHYLYPAAISELPLAAVFLSCGSQLNSHFLIEIIPNYIISVTITPHCFISSVSHIIIKNSPVTILFIYIFPLMYIRSLLSTV